MDQVGMGARSASSPSDFNSAHKAAGIVFAMSSTFRFVSAGETAPGIIDVTEGWPSGNCKAAAGSGTA
jgi:hypothetical protein